MDFQKTLTVYQDFFKLTNEEMRKLLDEKIGVVSLAVFRSWRYGGREPQEKMKKMFLQRLFNPWLYEHYGECLEFRTLKRYSTAHHRMSEICLEDPDKKSRYWKFFPD